MWDDFKCTKSAPKVPRALEKARALEKPPTVDPRGQGSEGRSRPPSCRGAARTVGEGEAASSR